MKRVTGIGGVFLKSKDPAALSAWYQKHLGIEMLFPNGSVFQWNVDPGGMTVWSIFKQESKYFEPSTSQVMLNYRVEDLTSLLETLRAEGVEIVGDVSADENGKFGWILDPDGNKIELWEPPKAS